MSGVARFALSIRLAVCFALFSGPAVPQPGVGPSILIEHVTVIDATGAPARPDMSVLIVGDKIARIEPSSRMKSPPGAIKVDARRKFLIPGLWDMHVHCLNKNQPDLFFPLFVANGVTGVRDMGGDLPLREIARLKQEVGSGTRVAPEIFAAGPILEGEHPFWPFSIPVKSADDGKQAVLNLVQAGADFIKVYNTLSRDAYLAIATQAKQSGVPFAGHIPDGVSPAEASELGQKSIEHLWGVPVYLTTDPDRIHKLSAEADDAADPNSARDLYYKVNQAILASYDPSRAHALFNDFIRNGTWQTPTFVVLRSYRSIHDPKLRLDPRLAYMPNDLIKFWDSMGGKPDPRNDEIQLRLYAHNIEIVKAMHEAHVPLLAGTDTPNPYTYPGFSLPDELEILVSTGLSPMELLQTATLRAAQFLGVDRDFGTVETGKIANLVLLDANPLEGIANTRKVRAVVLRGKFLDRSALDGLLEKSRSQSQKTTSSKPK